MISVDSLYEATSICFSLEKPILCKSGARRTSICWLNPGCGCMWPQVDAEPTVCIELEKNCCDSFPFTFSCLTWQRFHSNGNLSFWIWILFGTGFVRKKTPGKLDVLGLGKESVGPCTSVVRTNPVLSAMWTILRAVRPAFCLVWFLLAQQLGKWKCFPGKMLVTTRHSNCFSLWALAPSSLSL